jgi:enoyl-CoA hydratase/carnithine racemase
MSETIRVERDGGVASLVLSNPPLNLFGRDAFEALTSGIADVEISDARALVWRAEGDIFSGGVDVAVFKETDPRHSDELFAALVAAVRRLEALPIPTVAVVHGLCLTAALEVALGCDMILAAESARFGLVEAVVGLTPGAGGTQRMAERAGPARAREFVMTGGLYDAATLERWNVVSRVFPDDELNEKAMAFAQRLAAGPTLAHAATKRIVRAYREGGVDRADRETPKAAGGLFATEDLQNAVESFLRDGPGKATFQGR